MTNEEYQEKINELEEEIVKLREAERHTFNLYTQSNETAMRLGDDNFALKDEIEFKNVKIKLLQSSLNSMMSKSHRVIEENLKKSNETGKLNEEIQSLNLLVEQLRSIISYWESEANSLNRELKEKQK